MFIVSPAFHPGTISVPVSEQLKAFFFFPGASFTSPLIQYKLVLENKFSFSLQKSFSYLKVIIVSRFSHFSPKLITANNLNASSWSEVRVFLCIPFSCWNVVLIMESFISCCLMRWAFRALIWAHANLGGFSGTHRAQHTQKETKLRILFF